KLRESDTARIRKEILDAGRIIISSTDRTPENRAFHDARYRLYELAAANADADLIRILHDDPEVRVITGELFPVSCEAGIFEECAIAAQLLAEDNLTFGKIYRSYYGEVYETLMLDELAWLTETGGIDIAAQRVAYIGGGAMPIPAMLLAQRMGCKVTIIDPHAESCRLATDLIRRTGLSHLVEVECSGGEVADYAAYTLVWMANWIPNKRPIFKTLHKFPNIRYVMVRSAAQDSLSFIINDEVGNVDLGNDDFGFVHETVKRACVSLVSVILGSYMRAPQSQKAAPIVRRVVDNMAELIGNTPMLRLDPEKTGLKNIELYAKLEHMNPFGSIKDRTALGMIGPHIRGIADKGMQILEMSSGNAARGLQAIASMHGTSLETISGRIRIEEMRKVLQLQGAKLVPLPPDLDPADAYAALKMVDSRASSENAKYFYTDQYRNPANDGTHYGTTGREILEDIGPVDYLVGSVGTAGSTVGISRQLKEANAALEIVGVVSDHHDFIPGIRHKGEIFDVGPFDENYYNELVDINAQDAIDGVISLIRDFGVMAGPSSGAAYSAALKYLREADAKLTSPRKAVFVVCDRVELYLSYIAERRPDLFS
ncbi:MAG: pyridoxal-phosphate dependent enzyme, partial [Alphaproteobacteria bacterium]|nr:pyridoxal-phosphate dependent enzyme [Alphaproteobacteria bacterium]